MPFLKNTRNGICFLLSDSCRCPSKGTKKDGKIRKDDTFLSPPLSFPYGEGG